MSSTKNAIQKAMEGQLIPPQVYLPPVFVDRKELVTSWDGFDKYKPPTIAQQRIRINVECDPVGQLMAIANGLPIASYVVHPPKEEGGEPTVEIRYETADLKTRIMLLQQMQGKVVSDLSRTTEKKDKDDANEDDAEWERLTRDAARKGGSGSLEK